MGSSIKNLPAKELKQSNSTDSAENKDVVYLSSPVSPYNLSDAACNNVENGTIYNSNMTRDTDAYSIDVSPFDESLQKSSIKSSKISSEDFSTASSSSSNTTRRIFSENLQGTKDSRTMSEDEHTITENSVFDFGSTENTVPTKNNLKV